LTLRWPPDSWTGRGRPRTWLRCSPSQNPRSEGHTRKKFQTSGGIAFKLMDRT
jgi:hypothetical protein